MPLRLLRNAIKRPGVAHAGTVFVFVILTCGRSAAEAGRGATTKGMAAAKTNANGVRTRLIMDTPITTRHPSKSAIQNQLRFVSA
ncbi:exported hypothetical protein [Hyphomicrobium sp. GJ21]|nr:exported hypothetical protein [Hyphomicrobium sp. GJ21]